MDNMLNHTKSLALSSIPEIKACKKVTFLTRYNSVQVEEKKYTT